MFIYLVLKVLMLGALNVWHYWIIYEGISTYQYLSERELLLKFKT